MISFAVQKPLSLCRLHLFIFIFVSLALGDSSKKILLQFMSKNVLPVFSSRSFTVSSLTCWPLIHFETLPKLLIILSSSRPKRPTSQRANGKEAASVTPVITQSASLAPSSPSPLRQHCPLPTLPHQGWGC